VPVKLEAFWIDRYPVTNDVFLEFVKDHPKWRRSRIKGLFSDASYLSQWKADLRLGLGLSHHPVTRVSWFAARAYCNAHGGELPTTDQWEYAAGAKEGFSNGTRALILEWYGRPATRLPGRIGSGSRDARGIHDLFGLVWEWTLDFDSTMSSDELRNAGTNDSGLFCGLGGQGALDASDYASFMRYSFRNSLKASYTTASLGFRCVKETTP
jgi:formylglycine-generating enzyme required for sulfatase activity